MKSWIKWGLRGILIYLIILIFFYFLSYLILNKIGLRVLGDIIIITIFSPVVLVTILLSLLFYPLILIFPVLASCSGHPCFPLGLIIVALLSIIISGFLIGVIIGLKINKLKEKK